MSDPGDPYGEEPSLQYGRRFYIVSSSNQEPTAAKPWPGDYVSVPPWLNGCPVIATVAKPSPLGHEFVAILVDNGRQGGPAESLNVVEVDFTKGYRIRRTWPGYTSYQVALRVMLDVANLDEGTAEALATRRMSDSAARDE